ncbi:MAG TPA: DUF3579 domain-containing protein [Burkholderiaceae bacterium]|nr:DUF3579 domain-containing protein [Burkholderiaceae bacterium]
MSNLLDLPVSVVAEIWKVSDLPRLGEFLIHGVTRHGKLFRPSDWSERLCGVMACFRPGGAAAGRDALIGYSPFVQPVTFDGLKCVLVDPALREVEVMALDFVVNFARDNTLKVTVAQSPWTGN